MRTEPNDLAALDIIHELHAGRIAADALDQRNLNRTGCSGGACSCHRCDDGKDEKPTLSHCLGREPKPPSGVARHDWSPPRLPARTELPTPANLAPAASRICDGHHKMWLFLSQGFFSD